MADIETEVNRRVAEELKKRLGGKPPDETAGDIEPFPDQPSLRTLPSGRMPMNFGGGGLGKSILASVIVTFVIVLGMAAVFGGGPFVTKVDDTKNKAGLVAAIEKANADLAKTQTAVATAVQGIPNTVSTSVTNAINQAISQFNSQIASLTTKVDSANASASALATKVTNLETQFNAYKTAADARIAALEAKHTTSTGGATGEEIGLTVKGYYEDLYIELPATTTIIPPATITVAVPFTFNGEVAKLTVSNLTGKAVEDVRLAVEISLSGSLPAPYVADLSGGTAWTSSSLTSSSMRFKSSRFKLAVGETKRIYLILDISGTQPADKAAKKVYFDDLSSEVEDYSVVQ